jgi:hypothetical protein
VTTTSFEIDLCEGVAELLAADVDATQNVAWSDTGVYPAGKTGIYILAVPAIPNRIITLSTYGLGDDAVYGDSDVGLQVRTRSAAADPRDVQRLDAAIFDVLVGRFPFTLATGVRVQTLVRSSAVSLGQDDNLRWSFAANYRLSLHRPGTHRL